MTVQINGTSGITTPGITTDTSVANTSSTLTGESLNRIKTYTAQATTSGTSIVFPSIPSWAKRITVNLDLVSTNGIDQVCVSLGTSSGIDKTGYQGSSCYINSTAGGALASNIGTGGITFPLTGASSTRSGKIIIENISNNIWVFSGQVGDTASGNIVLVAGRKSLASLLTQLALTTINGTDTFDAGLVNILVEG